MSINDIRLQGSQVAGLYPSSLVELRDAKEAAGSPAAFLGQNARSVLIVTNDPAAPFIGDAELAFLTNVLGACGLSLADVAVVNWQRRGDGDGPSLSDGLKARQVLLFGIEPDAFGLPVNFPPFQVQSLAGRTYLHGPGLDLISADKEQKKALWNALRKMFSV